MRKRIAHFVMNLPDSAITFLDAFRGVLVPSSSSSSSQAAIDLSALYDVMPMVHCHCFTRELEHEAAERDIRHVRAFFRFPN
jgi:tRNA (guanine37-N1)-methyltransferase